MSEIPDGVQRVVKIKTAAEMLGFKERRVRGWIERGEVDYRQRRKRKMRFIPVTEVVEMAKFYGVEIDWKYALL